MHCRFTIQACSDSGHSRCSLDLPLTLRQQSTAEQYKQVSDAIAGSPALAWQLSAAADTGRLKGMRVADEKHPPEGPFLATLADGRLELNDRNVAAVAEGLHKRSLLDFGVPPRF